MAPLKRSEATSVKSRTAVSWWWHLLRCPDCRQAFEFKSTAQGNATLIDERSGLLECACFRYPVVDGIPILLKERLGVFAFWGGDAEDTGLAITEIVKLLDAGQSKEALLRCLCFTPHFRILDRLPGWRLWHRGLIPWLGRQYVRRRVLSLIASGEDVADDWFDLFYGRLAATDPYFLYYYRNRFTLPRTLATHAILQRLPADSRPLLDLATGFGPFAHYLTRRAQPVDVIGLDFNFYMLWGQQRLVAPDAAFVCADASKRLPFEDAAFSAVMCSDAFGYIGNKTALAEEFRRCAPQRPVILSRVGNRAASPSYSGELTPVGYMKLLAQDNPLVFGEQDLVRHYLTRTNPFSAAPTDPAMLGRERWINIVLNGDAMEQAAVADAEASWPHGVGQLELNPIFGSPPAVDGRVALRLEFPTVWFAYQNGDMFAYHADGITVDAGLLARARSGERTPEILELIERFVLVGLPTRYKRERYPVLKHTGQGAGPVERGSAGVGA